jgi:putative alpha-1,2-mannosidase
MIRCSAVVAIGVVSYLLQ